VAWQYSAEELLSQVPAEQLISWCDWLVDDDLPRFKVQKYGPTRDSHRDLDVIVSPRINGLRDTLCDLWARCCLERTDPVASIRVRAKQLMAWAGDAIPGAEVDADGAESPVPVVDAWAFQMLKDAVNRVEKEQLKEGRIPWDMLTERFLDERSTSHHDRRRGPMVSRFRERFLRFILDVAEGEIERRRDASHSVSDDGSGGAPDDVSQFLLSLPKYLKKEDENGSVLLHCLHLTAENALCAAGRAFARGKPAAAAVPLKAATPRQLILARLSKAFRQTSQ
jgi:hypothetical protein